MTKSRFGCKLLNMMGFELNYDAFMGLSFGFFVAYVSVRLKNELGNGIAQLRRRQSRHGSDVPSYSASDSIEGRREFAD